jgi:hypothetical protein
MSRTPATSDRRIEILEERGGGLSPARLPRRQRRRDRLGARNDEGQPLLYFKNKEEILFACHEYSLDKLLALMKDVLGESTSPEASCGGSSSRSST